MNSKDRFGKFINFASGAEFDRTSAINSNKNNLLNSYPTDPYGMSKNIISRILQGCINCYNFRVFGVFGIDEDEQRFIKSNIKRYKNKENLPEIDTIIELYEDIMQWKLWKKKYISFN